MARIRSIHPGLFTDEAFMSASPHARLLIIGLWCEAWDDGVFDWKPLTIKARVFPVDAVDVATLLAELVELRFVRRFEANGKPYGVIRNFQKYQRPKKPNSSGVLPSDLSLFAGRSDNSSSGSEGVRNQFGTGGEKSPQMEDGEEDGGGREGGNEEDTADAGRHPRAYAFEAGKIRLTEIDLARWVKAFPNISVEAELYSLADWAGRPENSAKWFNAVAGALAKKNRDAIDRKARAEAEAAMGVQSVAGKSYRDRGFIP